MPANLPVFRHEFTALARRCSLQFLGAASADALAAARRIEQRVTDLAARYSFQARDSWLNRVVNDRHGEVVEDADAALLATVRAHASRTRGAFDITLGTYAGPLRRARTAYDIVAVRRRLARFAGLERWEIAGRTLRFDNGATRLDLGGVVKGLAMDESAAIARAAGMAAGRIEVGGDVLAFGTRPDGRPFVATISSPRHPQRTLCGVDLEDQALAASAHHARKGPAQPIDAAPADARWISASIVSRSALLSAIYSRALLIHGDIDLPPDMHAVTIAHDDSVHRWCRGEPA